MPIAEHGLETRNSLLLQIRDARNSRAWCEFVDLYAPLLHAYGLRNGLQDADAADLAQDTLRQVLRNIGRFDYDRSKGTFRGWLLTIARNRIRRLCSPKAKRAVAVGDAETEFALEQTAAPEEIDCWEREYQFRILHLVAQRIEPEFRDKTWRAFWHTVVDGEDIGAVAAQLGMSVGAVYIARSRVIRRIKEEISRIESED